MERVTHILLVEDDELDVMNVRRALSRAQVNAPLHVAQNGLEALEKLRGGELPRRTVVLLDLNMPRMSGLEFLDELRRDPALRGTPVVVLTTSADERDRGAAYQHCVAGYMIKPTSFEASIDFAAALGHYWGMMEMS
ncbi:MAG: response regulator [Deltaproteobacteria bacterium]|nr:response regulator [Deltaproteobacteria bacterium]